MQLNGLVARFTSCQLRNLTSVMVITFTIFVTTAKAQAQIDYAPDPISSQATGTTGQGIEGLEEIIENRAVAPNSPFTGISSMPPSTVIGSGDLLNITQTAFDVWLTAFPELENVDINIGVGWADFMIDPNKIQTPLSTTLPTFSFDEASPDGILTDLAAFYVHADENFPDANTSIPNSNLDGLILFNSQENLEVKKEKESDPGRVLYYLDPDPLSSSIFGSVASENYIERQKNGINYGRSKFVTSEEDPFASLGANPNDLVIDVFSVALHELQHALGLTRVNPNAVDKLVPTAKPGTSNLAGNLDLKIDLPDFSGAIPTTYNANDPDLHLNDDLDLINETDFDFIPQSLDNRVSRIKEMQIPTPVSLEIVTDRERKCPSAADVLAIAEINGYTNYDTNPCLTLAKQRVPEPSTMFFLFGLGIYGSLQLRRNRLQ